jgi:hypothetical protein
MNSLSANNQPFPPKDAKPGECPPDSELPENSQENLDARSTMPSRKPSRPAIRSRSTSPKGRSLIVKVRNLPRHRQMTIWASQSRTQPSIFSIR